MFLRTVKIFVRLDPEVMDFHFGIDEFRTSVSFGSDSLYDGEFYAKLQVKIKFITLLLITNKTMIFWKR